MGHIGIGNVTVTAIVPAHNEGDTIGAVLEAVAGSRAVGQIVVVCDACSDATFDVAQSFGADTWTINAGDKGTAMAVGLMHAGGADTLFLDGDVVGLTAGHVDALATLPPRGGMVVGIRSSATDSGLPPISGERRLPTAFARGVRLAGMGYRAELSIDAAAARAGLPHRHVKLAGVTNPTRPWRHPLLWADLATFALFHAPALVDYTIRGTLATG